MKRRLVKLLPIIALLILSYMFTCLSVFLPVTIHNRSELKHVDLGFPFSYIVRNHSALPVGYPDSPSFPIRQTLISPWEYPLNIIWWRFILNIAVILVALSLIFFATKILWQRLRSALTHKVSPARP